MIENVCYNPSQNVADVGIFVPPPSTKSECPGTFPAAPQSLTDWETRKVGFVHTLVCQKSVQNFFSHLYKLFILEYTVKKSHTFLLRTPQNISKIDSYMNQIISF